MINGIQLDAIRATLGLSKEYLAMKLGISRPTLDKRLADPKQLTGEQASILAKELKIEISNFYA